jgi:1-acyl-sn-glycerol-3-phosphate acyltransferase
MRILQNAFALFITLLLWAYFLFGSVVFFFLFYIPAYLFSSNRVAAFQNLNHIHMKNFFALTHLLIPRTKFDIQKEIRHIHSSIVVCNHLSYLDPILLISLFQRQVTIVKSTFFKVPFFGWLLKTSGYVPSVPSEMLGPAMIKNLEEIKKHLAAGGNLFVFPEGTRSRDGNLTPFNKGVFSIARYCNAPLKLIFIKDTNKLFQPGHFLFHARDFNTIQLKLIGSLDPDYKSTSFSISAVADQARKLFEERIQKDKAKQNETPTLVYGEN